MGGNAEFSSRIAGEGLRPMVSHGHIILFFPVAFGRLPSKLSRNFKSE